MEKQGFKTMPNFDGADKTWSETNQSFGKVPSF